MRQSTYRISVALIVLVFASLACGLGGDKEPTATPVPPAATQAPPPTNTPEPAAPAGNVVSAESETLGVRLSYPEDWFYDDSFFIVLSSVPDADLSGDEMPEGVIIFIIAGPFDEMGMEGSPEDIVAEEFGGSGDTEFLGDPVETIINGVPVTIVEFRVTEEGETVHGKVAIYDNGEQAAGVIAFGPDELWNEHAATVDAILESIELFEGTGFDFGITPSGEEGEWRGDLAYGDSVSDEFAGGDVHNWTFDGSAGEYVTTIVTPLGEEMDVTIQLLASDGTTLLEMDNAWAGEAEVLLDHELPDDGEYTIVVEELFEEAGPYELELRGSPDPMGAIVPPGTIEQGELVVGETFIVTLAESEKHAWTLYSTGVSQRVSVALTPGEGMDVVLSIIAPDGTMLVDELDEAVDGEPEVAQCVTLEQEGQYIVVVDEFWDMTAGEYSLEASDCGDGSGYIPDDDYVVTEMGEIAYGESQRGELLEGQYIHAWLLSGGTGDVVTIVVEPLTTDADLQLGLMDPDGEFLFDLDDGGSGEAEQIESYELPATGIYTIFVAEYWESYTEYELGVTLD